jgi:CRISPR/Cas system-associated endoribonuclease Cas2
MPERTALFAYDIHDPRVRRAALRSVCAWRLDGQLSVHECVLGEAEAGLLFDQLNDNLDPRTDCLLFAWVQGHRPILARGLGRAAPRGGLLHIA